MDAALTLSHRVQPTAPADELPYTTDEPRPEEIQVDWAGVYAANPGRGTIRSFDVVTLEPGEQYGVTDGQPSPCAEQVVARALQQRQAAGWRLDPTQPILVVPTCGQDRHDFHLLIVAWWARP